MSGFGEIWDSRSIKGKDKLSTDPLTILKNQHFQIPLRSGSHGHVSTSSYELLSALCKQITIYKIFFTAILASLDPFYKIYGASNWNGRLRAPAFPFFLLLVQLKILNVDKTASRGEETAKKSKTKTQGESFLFLFLSKKKKWNLGCIVFIFIHFLIKSQRTPTELGRLRRM